MKNGVNSSYNLPFNYLKSDRSPQNTMQPRPITLLLSRAQFLTSAAKASQSPADQGLEVAFAGRSNAGKSSALNTLTRQRQLARSSKTPGRTRLINFFSLDEQRRLVDLPGYGYAAVSESIKLAWQKELENYLVRRRSLTGLIVLMDIRHPLKDLDLMLLDWAQGRGLPVHILLTKCDKLNRGPALNLLQATEEQLRSLGYSASLQLFSSLNKNGIEEAEDLLSDWLKEPDLILPEA